MAPIVTDIDSVAEKDDASSDSTGVVDGLVNAAVFRSAHATIASPICAVLKRAS